MERMAPDVPCPTGIAASTLRQGRIGTPTRVAVTAALGRGPRLDDAVTMTATAHRRVPYITALIAAGPSAIGATRLLITFPSTACGIIGIPTCGTRSCITTIFTWR